MDLREADSRCVDEDGNQLWCHGDFSNIYLNTYYGGQGTLATFYQFFTCPQDSTLGVKYKVAFEGTENEDKIWVRVNGVQIGESIELDRFTLESPLNFSGESLDGLSYAAGVPFQVEFTLRHSHENDHIFIYDIQLRCIECSECDSTGQIKLATMPDGNVTWERHSFTRADENGVETIYQTPTFRHNGPVVALDGAVKYVWKTNQMNGACAGEYGMGPEHGCAFGSKAYGYIGQIPAIAVFDENGNQKIDEETQKPLYYKGHYPLENQIFAVINDQGFECSIEVIGEPSTAAVNDDANEDGAPEEAEGQIWLRAWTIPQNYYDIDPSSAQATIREPSEVIEDDDKQWCPLDGIVYIARDGEGDSYFGSDTTSFAGVGEDVDPDPSFILSSSEIVQLISIVFVIAIITIIIAYCICQRKGNGYSHVKVVEYSTDSETV